MLLVLLILLFSLSHQQNGFGCTVAENNFWYYQNGTNGTVSIQIMSHNTNGYLVLSFGDTLDMKNHSFFIVSYLPNNYHFFNTSNFDKTLNTSYIVEVFNIFQYLADNLLHLRVDLPYRFISRFKYSSIARNFNSNPIKIEDLKLPEVYFTRTNSLFNESLLGSTPMTHCVADYMKLPGRLVDYHLGIFIPTLVFYIVIMILCLLFINVQPLKTRGLGPFFIPFFMSINLIVEYIVNTFTFEQQIEFRCLPSSYVLHPVISATGIVPLITYFRYLLLNHSNLRKEKYINKDMAVRELPLYIRIINRITNPFVILIFLGIHFIVWGALVTVIFGIFKFDCSSFGSTINTYLHALWSLGYALIVALFQIFDLLINIKLWCKCQVKKFYVDRDPFFFRIEFLLTFFIPIFALIWIVITPSLLKNLFVDLAFFFILWNFSLCILVITMFKWIKSKIEKQPQLDELSKLFQNEELKDLFIDFCKKEWSLENALFYQDTMTYRSSAEKRRSEIAERMKRLYLSFELSPLEINVPAEKINETIKKMHDHKLSDDLFQDLEAIVVMNMKDTSLRFVKTKEYQIYLVKNKLISA